MDRIRERSVALTRRLIDHATRRGYRLNTPIADRERGGTVVIDVPRSADVAAELIERGVLIDHRPGAGLRVAPHFYNTDEDIDRALATLDELVGTTVAAS